MAEAGLTWGREPRRAGVARLKNGCEPPPCGTGRWASWGSARRPQQECGPVGVAMTEEGSGLCQDQGRRPKPSSRRAGPAPASAPTSSRRPGAGSQEGPGCRQGRGSRLRVLSVRLLSALQSPCLSRSPACPGNREPWPLCHRRTTVSVMSPRRRTRGRKMPCWTEDGHGPPESRPRRAPREDSGRGTRGTGESSLFSGGRGGKLWALRLRAAWSAGPPRREGHRPPHGRGLATHHVWLRLGVLWGFIFIPLIFFS